MTTYKHLFKGDLDTSPAISKIQVLAKLAAKRDLGQRTTLSDEQVAKRRKRPGSSNEPGRILEVELPVQADFFAAFTFAHRARRAASILLRALADILRFLGIGTTLAFSSFAFTFAQRALWAAAILAFPAADILPRGAVRFPYAAPKADSAAPIALISLFNRSCSLLKICTTPPRFVIESPSREIVAGRLRPECWSEKPVDTVQFRAEPPDPSVG
jgi:hypothetical protein